MSLPVSLPPCPPPLTLPTAAHPTMFLVLVATEQLREFFAKARAGSVRLIKVVIEDGECPLGAGTEAGCWTCCFPGRWDTDLQPTQGLSFPSWEREGPVESAGGGVVVTPLNSRKLKLRGSRAGLARGPAPRPLLPTGCAGRNELGRGQGTSQTRPCPMWPVPLTSIGGWQAETGVAAGPGESYGEASKNAPAEGRRTLRSRWVGSGLGWASAWTWGHELMRGAGESLS